MNKYFMVVFLSSGYCFSNVPSKPTQVFGNTVWHDSYQDQVVNNQVIVSGRVKNLQERYEVINSIVSQYKRPITLLDIGAAQGYYDFRLGYNRKNDVYVMIEEDPYLSHLAALNTDLNNVICLQKRVSIEDLVHLGECEHFDVVLALSVIHWSEERWKEMTDAILALGDRIIIETPPAGDKAIGAKYLGDIEKYLESKGAKILLKLPRHTGTGLLANMYLLEMNKKNIGRASWFENGSFVYRIEGDLHEKKLVKYTKDRQSKISETSWQPGINMTTFQALSGVFPGKNLLEDSLSKIQKDTPKIRDCDLLLQGKFILPLHYIR